MKKIFKGKKGITLIALIITIIVLIILAGVSINLLLGENGIITKVIYTSQLTEKTDIVEDIKLKILEEQIDKGENFTNIDLENILKEYGTLNRDEEENLKSLIPTDKDYEIPIKDIIGDMVIKEVILKDGSWNYKSKVNSPKVDGTGLIPVYWDENGIEKELTSSSTDEEWKQWYDYDNQKWANAITKDENGNITGYFVWIPRYEYSIDSSTKTVNIKFIPTEQIEADEDYTYVHPAFSDNIKNGGWNKNISGLWFAKYQAGYQANTVEIDVDAQETNIINASDNVIYSDSVYTYVTSYSNNSNVLGPLKENVTKISYPVFKPLTYSYNKISIGDAYSISRKVQDSKEFYGLLNIDSHMVKNSEWGAVVYLMQSVYGRNKTEVSHNGYCITGIYSTLCAYNTNEGVKGSSTNNVYGVYDLSGCYYEYVAGYIYNDSIDYEKISSFATGISTEYATVYPYDTEIETAYNNYLVYKSLQTSDYGYGDAILETSNVKASGSTTSSWYYDNSMYPYKTSESYIIKTPFFNRGGRMYNSSDSGAFAFRSDTGISDISGFRIVLIAE